MNLTSAGRLLRWAWLMILIQSMPHAELQAQTGGSLDVPQTRLAPLGTTPQGMPSQPGMTSSPAGIAPSYGAAPATSLGAPSIPSGSFDPYAGGPAGGYVQPSPYSGLPMTGGMFAPATPSYGAGPTYGGLASQPPPILGGSTIGTPSVMSNAFGGAPVAIPSSGYAGPLFGGGGYGTTMVDPALTAPGYGATAYPSASPSTLFPGGIIRRPGSLLPPIDPYRLIQRVRLRHTFLGDPGDSSDINTTDIAFAFAFQRFLWSSQPLFVAPSFSWHQPHEYDLYDAFVDFAWQSDPSQIAGMELQFGAGVFSEFGIYDTDSIRLRGRGLGVIRLSPATTFKLGVQYYDRQRVKILPAGGFFWQPNPFTKIDFYFPQPRVSRFLATLGTQDVWWYLSGEYGEGSWTRRVTGLERQMGGIDIAGDERKADINDMRVIFGLELGRSELIRAGRRTWFAEVGYVFNREIFVNEALHQDLDDTFMIRLGVGY
ncbi:hypothetical protein U8335_02940 [Roseiconus lacunae]|uniref:hypothetical protein n=1 Tax=Roseiconus lacunae TaxID=2605694 RepID=UPI001E3E70AB|nr:hypothetical protein [Roseiconus lacunae]MCD0461340.1 hypothetical protein [Roseiconus lacunae]WRQ51499.1 hypothetical protein U8335_02940 [Stieleria sp. HD01]